MSALLAGGAPPPRGGAPDTRLGGRGGTSVLGSLSTSLEKRYVRKEGQKPTRGVAGHHGPWLVRGISQRSDKGQKHLWEKFRRPHPNREVWMEHWSP